MLFTQIRIMRLNVHFKLLSSLFSTQKIFIQFQRKLLARHNLRNGFM